MEAEFVAAHTAYKTAKWIFDTLKEMGVEGKCVKLYCDNMAAIRAMKDTMKGKYNKHIGVKYYINAKSHIRK